MKFDYDWPSGFRGEETCEHCGRTTVTTSPEDGYTLNCPCEPNGSDEHIANNHCFHYKSMENLSCNTIKCSLTLTIKTLLM